MRTILKLALLFALPTAILLSCSEPKEPKSFKPGQLWPDNNGKHINAHGGGILFHEGSYYWFGEHKIEGEAGNLAQVGVHCYSSKNLYDWKDEGIALPVVTGDPDHDIAKGCILERPKVIYNAKTKKFVMWFHLEWPGQGYATARSGVATSDKVTGPYTFVKSVRPNKGQWPNNVSEKMKTGGVPERVASMKFTGGEVPEHPDSLNLLARDFEVGQMARDMNLFVDDDGKGYHIYSSEENSTLHISLLTDDFLDYEGAYVREFPGRFMEAPALFKRKGKYYLIASGCTGWRPNAARSAVADNILGPWRELKNPCVGEGSDLTFKSQSTYVLPVNGKEDAFVYLGDRWTPENAIDGRYIWLPLTFEGEQPVLKWADSWDLNFFDKK
ncbi:beta-glucanase [Fulvitalea axinellae]|uniref:Beta-glucanase n=1 Tax=Fulvitalea axinellae TaxID=1182444 RepID=A0AAU9D169_9BACT|nr:beta-glucanase [Fulvitalea axinellae]